jgi:hypothetical protein
MSSTNSRYLSVASGHIDSLISYVLDVKPYHVKLSEIVEEYLFNDNVNVKIADHQETLAFLGADILPAYSSQHNVRRRRATSWYKDLTSDGTRTTWQVPLTVINKLASQGDNAGIGFNKTLSQAQEPFIHGRTRTVQNIPPVYIDPLEAIALGYNTDNVETDNDFQIPGINNVRYANDEAIRSGAFNPKRWNGPGAPIVTKNGEMQADSIDYFLSHGAFSFDVRVNKKWKELNLTNIATFGENSGDLTYNSLVKTYGTISDVTLGNYEEWTITWNKPDNATRASVSVYGTQSGFLTNADWFTTLNLNSQLVYADTVRTTIDSFAYGDVNFSGFNPDLLAVNRWANWTFGSLDTNRLYLLKDTTCAYPASQVNITGQGDRYIPIDSVITFDDGSNVRFSATLPYAPLVTVPGSVQATLPAGTLVTIHGGQEVSLNANVSLSFLETDLVTSAAGVIETFPDPLACILPANTFVTLPDGTSHKLIAATHIDVASGTVLTIDGYPGASAATRPVSVVIASGYRISILDGTIINPNLDFEFSNAKLGFHLVTNPGESIEDGESFTLTPSTKITVGPAATPESWSLIKTNPFTTVDREEHYLVYGSESGWLPNLSLSAAESAKSKGARIGEWYWNGKIGFKIPALQYFPRILNATIISSAEGEDNTWTTEVSSSQIIKGISFDSTVNGGHGAFFITGEDSIAGTSPDGKTWSSDVGSTYAFDAANPFRVLSITGDNGKIYLSTPVASTDSLGNPITVIKWIEQQVPTLGTINAVTQIPNALYSKATDATPTVTCILAVGEQGIILSSANGVGWTPAVTSNRTSLNDITYSSSAIVAVGQDGTILKSTDRLTWVKQISHTDYHLTSVIYVASLGMFIAVGQHGTILSSTDGSNWLNLAPNVGDADFSDVVFGIKDAANPGKLIAVSKNGIIATSTNGSIWSAYAGKSLNSIAFGNGTFIGVGGSRNEIEHFITHRDVSPLAEPSEYTITFVKQQTETEEGLATVTNNIYGFRPGLKTNTAWDDELISFTLETVSGQTKYQVGDIVKVYLAPEMRYIDFAGYDDRNFAVGKYDYDFAEYSAPLIFDQEIFPLYHSHGSVIFKDTLRLDDRITIDKATTDSMRLRIIGSGLAFPELSPVEDWIPLELRFDSPFPELVKYIYAYSSANPDLLVLTIEQPQYNSENINASATLKFDPSFVSHYLKFNTKFSLAFYPDESYGQKIRVKVTEDFKIYAKIRMDFFDGPLYHSYYMPRGWVLPVGYKGNHSQYNLSLYPTAHQHPFNLNISDAPIKHFETLDKIAFFEGPAIGYHYWEYITQLADPTRPQRNHIVNHISDTPDPLANPIVWQGWGIKHVTATGYDFYRQVSERIPPQPILWTAAEVAAITQAEIIRQATDPLNQNSAPKTYYWYNGTPQSPVKVLLPVVGSEKTVQDIKPFIHKTDHHGNDLGPLFSYNIDAAGVKTYAQIPNQDISPARTPEIETTWELLYSIDPYAAHHEWYNLNTSASDLYAISATYSGMHPIINMSMRTPFGTAMTEGGALPLENGFGHFPYQVIKNGVMKGLKKVVAPYYTALPSIQQQHAIQPAPALAVWDTITYSQQAFHPGTFTWTGNMADWTFPKVTASPSIQIKQSLPSKMGYEFFPYGTSPLDEFPYNLPPYKNWTDKNGTAPAEDTGVSEASFAEGLFITERAIDTRWLSGYDTTPYDASWENRIDPLTGLPSTAAPLGYPYDTPLDYVAAKVNFILDYKNIKMDQTTGEHYMDVFPPQFTNLAQTVDEYMVTVLNKKFTSSPTFIVQALVASTVNGKTVYVPSGTIDNPPNNLHNPFPELPDITSMNAYVFNTAIPMPFRLTIT